MNRLMLRLQLNRPSNRPAEKHMSDEENNLHSSASPSSSSSNSEKDPTFLVAWDENDSLDPHNWSVGYKCWITIQLSMLALAGSLGSSITSPVDNVIGQEFGLSNEAAVLDISLYIIGFAAGPVIWAPISEIWGRRVSMLPATFCLGLFSIGTAASHNAAAVLITRFLAGFFGSAPISNVTAALGDFWSPDARGTAVAIYSIAVNGGPTLGPIIGSAVLLNESMSWRWTEYIEAIWVFTVFLVTFFCLPELYPSVLLMRKAQKLRKESGNDKYYHPHEDLKLDVKSIITKQLSRPLKMLFTEPIVTSMAFYGAFTYAILYITLEIFPVVFEDIRSWNPIIGSLPFLSLLVGILIGVAIIIEEQPRYKRIRRAAGGKPVPEARLPPMAIGAVSLVIGLFWFAWTATPQYHWILPIIAIAFIGAGFGCIFLQCLNFLIDCYGLYAASATAAVTFLRSLLAAGLPLAVRPMIRALDVGPAVSILGAVAAVLLPVPFLFMKFGPRIRAKSTLAPQE